MRDVRFGYPCVLGMAVKDASDWNRMKETDYQVWRNAGIGISEKAFEQLIEAEVLSCGINAFRCDRTKLKKLVKEISKNLGDRGIVCAYRCDDRFDVQTPSVMFCFGDKPLELVFKKDHPHEYEMHEMCYYVNAQDIQAYVNFLTWNSGYTFTEKELQTLTEMGFAPQEYTGDDGQLVRF